MSTPAPNPEIVDDPKRPYKAYAGAVLTGVGVFVAAWVADTDPFTGKECATAAISAVAAAVPGFGIVFAISNPKARRTR